MTETTPDPTAPPWPRWVSPVTGGTSLAMASVATLWLVRPELYPFGPQDRVTVSVTHLLGHGTAGTLLLLFAALALVAALLLRRPDRPWAVRAVPVLLPALSLALLLVFGDVSMMTSLGYLGFLAGAPLGVLALVVGTVRRRRGTAPALAAVLAVLALGAWAGFLRPSTLSTFAGNLAEAFAAYGTRLAWGVACNVLVIAMVLVTLRVLRGLAAGWTWPSDSARVRRWGVIATVVAAAGPAPYALERLTWLTPWPVGIGDSADLATRTQGVLIGLGAVAGVALTLTLLSRWGEVFPRWLPGVGGRTVPIAAAVVPGGVVAAAAALAAPGWVVNAVQRHEGAELTYALVLLPFAVWAPALAMAVGLYAVRRGWRPAVATA